MKKLYFTFMLLTFVIVSQAETTQTIIIADFEDGPPPSYWVNGSGEIVDNPLQSPPNESEKVYRYEKPDGAWRQYLINTTSYNIARKSFKSVSFQAYSGDEATEMTSYMFKVITQNQDENADLDWQVDLTMEPGWNTFTYVLSSREWTDRVERIEIYPLMESNDPGTFFFDNFIVEISTEVVAVSGVALNHSSLEMITGAQELLIATVFPDNAENQNITWSSSDENIVTVDFWGMVTAVGEGSAIITVTTEDGEFTATCVATVADPNVAVNKLTEQSFSVFPNPITHNLIKLDLAKEFKGESILKVFNLSGVLVKTAQINNKDKTHTIEIHLFSGTYILTLENNGRYYSKKIIVL